MRQCTYDSHGVASSSVLPVIQGLTEGSAVQDAKRVVRLWEAEFAKAAAIDRQMSLLYLANDILQNSRRKGPEFVNEFYHVMPRPISHLLKHGDNKARSHMLAPEHNSAADLP